MELRTHKLSPFARDDSAMEFWLRLSRAMNIPDIHEIGDRYRKHAGVPLFYFFSVERPKGFKAPETEPHDGNIPVRKK
uniref:Uncharacterized protein n=1 Tax=Candidatus Kentrum sp. LFY TaxID=2126342 RepID=A0A450UBK3_9GAMM|nr:MAG: hypothetical protein BECKLFY1418B_GA0070995_101620 [Candidatus Kentron sp. LFY]